MVKFRLVRQYGLAGMGCWYLGLTMPQIEEMVLDELIQCELKSYDI